MCLVLDVFGRSVHCRIVTEINKCVQCRRAKKERIIISSFFRYENCEMMENCCVGTLLQGASISTTKDITTFIVM